MHSGDKIRIIRSMKGLNQENIADAIGISRAGWQKQEATDIINELHWPALQNTIGLSKEQVEAMDEKMLSDLFSGKTNVTNKNEGSNYVCVVNLTINGADEGSVEKLRAMFEQLLSMQKSNGTE